MAREVAKTPNKDNAINIATSAVVENESSEDDDYIHKTIRVFPIALK